MDKTRIQLAKIVAELVAENNQLKAQNDQLKAQNEQYKKMLVEWQNWWNEHGFEWYVNAWSNDRQIAIFEKFYGPITKPPFLISGHPMHNQWVNLG